MSAPTSLAACLPAELQGPGTTITKIAVGFSGAEVHRVETPERAFVLKIASDAEPFAVWRGTVHIQELAARAGVAARVIHVDESRRAVVSAFVVDKGFAPFYRDPSTHAAALVQLARTLRRVHDLPLPAGAAALEPRDFLAAIWSGMGNGAALPLFVGEAVHRVLAEAIPQRERPPILSHNDANPSNLAYDGENILLLDWNTAGPNDPFYDLATVAVFLRMDEETSAKLIAAYDDAPVAPIPERFRYFRRLVAAAAGSMFLRFARMRGHGDATGAETVEGTLTLTDCYQRMRTGALSLGTADGQWAFGLALIKASLGL